VGAGAPWELAHYALRGAGVVNAASPLDSGTAAVWGQLIAVPQARPGDVLQLRNYEVVATTLHTAYFDDGSTRQRSEDTSRTYANHIAIVAAPPEERSVSVLEQLPALGSRVQERAILLRDCGPIEQRVFSWEHDAMGRVRPATVVQTTLLRVTGIIRIYRAITTPT
jgi:NMD protein affecting ribosome stability and mRNA decay